MYACTNVLIRSIAQRRCSVRSVPSQREFFSKMFMTLLVLPRTDSRKSSRKEMRKILGRNSRKNVAKSAR